MSDIHGTREELVAFIAVQRGEIERLREAIATCEAWIDRWADHAGSCQGGNNCTCGRTAVLHEARAALTNGEKVAAQSEDGK